MSYDSTDVPTFERQGAVHCATTFRIYWNRETYRAIAAGLLVASRSLNLTDDFRVSQRARVA